MQDNNLKSILEIGETIAVEFKRCGNGIENDVYESVCSFLNRFGGDIYMGVLNDGTVLGVPPKAANDMVKNFIKTISNPDLFTPIKYVTMDDFRLDLLPRLRKMATNNMEGIHSWESMNDEELLRSAGLFGTDRVTGDRGYNLAAVMLLGKDDVIKDICPAYETDALVRKVNVDRYDDREIIRTNLIESYDQLMEFARKNLPDKFFLEGTERKNLRNIISREMIGNILIHREFTSAYTAKFVIEKNRMYTENASRSAGDGIITPDNMEPNPKNPIIASFFRTIGWSDRLGSGVRNLYKYSKFYSGKEPEFVEGDIFKTVVPLDEGYSPDMSINKKTAIKNGDKKTAIKNGDKKTAIKTQQRYGQILEYMELGKEYMLKDFCNLLNLKESRTRELLKGLSEQIELIGSNKDRRYKLK